MIYFNIGITKWHSFDCIIIHTNKIYIMWNKNKHFFSILFLSSFSPIVASCQTGTNFFICDSEIAKHDINAWNTCINEIASSNCPTIYLTADSAYYLLQSSLIYYTSSELSTNNYHNKNDFADQIMLICFKNFQYKLGADSHNTSFGYSYWNLLGDAGGQRDEYKDILKYGVRDGNHMVITNLEDFDTDHEEYSGSSDNEYWWSNYIVVQKILEKIYAMYDVYQPNINFNFVIFDFLLDNFLTDSKNSVYLQRTIYSRANKIYFLSDGGYTYFTFTDLYAKRYAEFGYIDCKKQVQIWDALHSNVDNDHKNRLILQNPIAFFNNEKYCLFFTADDSWYKTYYDETCNLFPATMIKYAYSNINWLTHQSDFNLNDKTFSSLCHSIFLFFDEKNASVIKDGGDFVSLYATSDTYKHFDSKKKNIIIPTPSYIIDDNDIRDQNIRNIFDEMSKTYSPDKYNWIFKGHPRNDENLYYQKMQKILPKYYNNIVILKMKFPLEFLVVLDWQLAQTSNIYHIIEPSSFITNQPSGLLGGWSLDTTSIITLINLLCHHVKDGYVLGNENAKKILDLNSLFIPNKFNISSGKTINDYLSNFSSLSNLYKRFITTNKFVDINSFKIV